LGLPEEGGFPRERYQATVENAVSSRNALERALEESRAQYRRLKDELHRLRERPRLEDFSENLQRAIFADVARGYFEEAAELDDGCLEVTREQMIRDMVALMQEDYGFRGGQRLCFGAKTGLTVELGGLFNSFLRRTENVEYEGSGFRGTLTFFV
jgi:hypothetical protein